MSYVKIELEDNDKAIVSTKKAHISIEQKEGQPIIHISGETMNPYEKNEEVNE